MGKSKRVSEATFLGNVVKGALLASGASIALIAIYAFLIWKQWVPFESVSIVNTGIKVVSAAFGGIIAAAASKHRVWLTGGVTGAAYALFAYAVFSILSDTFSFSVAVIADVAIGTVSAALAAMVFKACSK